MHCREISAFEKYHSIIVTVMQLHKAIKEIEDGLLSIAEASRNYDITMGRIDNWLWSFGKDKTLMIFSLYRCSNRPTSIYRKISKENQKPGKLYL